MRCPECGTESPEGAKFCLECGAKLAAVCPECRAFQSPRAKFCSQCGARVIMPPSEAVTDDGATFAAKLQRLVPPEYAERLRAARHQVGRERRTVTILFSDVKGSTAIAEHLDPEEVMEIMDVAFDVLIEPVTRYEGTLARLMGDAVLAFFGAPIAHEDDPERAVRAALEITAGAQRYAEELERDRGIPGFGVRVGINTGLVVVGEVGTDMRVEYTAMGDAINLAARMEQNAPPGGILISHDTYRHVQGVFDVLPQEPLLVKGKAEAVRTYRVLRAKPRAFRMPTRGVEGIETRMVGRESELKRLQEGFLAAVEDGELGMVTVVGEAGVGKSRLLREFDAWAELLPEQFYYFKGRAFPEMQSTPYALLRDLVAFRFQIQDSDPAAVVQEKLEAGVAAVLGGEEDGRRAAHLIGHLAGFELSGSPFLTGEPGDARALRDEALACLTEYFLGMAARPEGGRVQSPVLILLEDLQWADESSLDALNHLSLALAEQPVMMIMAARPELYERRPRWGEGQGFHGRLELEPLSKWDSRRLVAEILQKVAEVPPALRDLIVAGAEGNPFFIEELVKMLVEDGVIVKGEERWSLESGRLADVQVPPTLTGVLQARLDRLPLEERTVLQQASVVGRLFWDRAVARINASAGEATEQDELPERLSDLRDREMVFQRETSAFADAQEYIFKHALLREITYESVLKKVRRAYHGLVADWLLEQGGERAEEYTGLIADHLELAGRTGEAVDYLLEAGDRARALYAHREAISAYERALILLKELGDDEQAARTLMKLGLVHEAAFDAHLAREAYDEGFALWQQAAEAEPAAPLPPAPHALRGTWTDVPTLDPGLADDAISGTAIGQLFSGLVEHTPEMGIVPGVAARWEVLEGGTRYIFYLRDDARWSDGLPLTAHDFEYAWKRILDPGNRSGFASSLFDIRGARNYYEGLVPDPEAVDVRAQDDRTLAVDLEAPSGYFLQLLAYAMPVPRHAVERWGAAWTDAKNMVCNGPFTLADWRRGEQLVLERNPLYHGRFGGNLERVEITLKAAGEWLRALEDYEADRADWFTLEVSSPEEMDQVRQRHAREYVSFPSASTSYVAFDVTCAPFADRRVRRALALALDREALVEAALGGYRFPATGGIVPPGMPGHVPGIGLPHDPDRAAKLLASAGYPGGQGFPEVELLANLRFQGRCERLQAQWRDHLGIEVRWQVMDWSDLLARIDDGPTPPMFLMGWIADYPDPDSFLRVAVQLHTAWRSEQYLDLVGRAQRSTDQSERMKLYVQVERLLAEDVPLLPLAYDRTHLLLKPWVKRYSAWDMDEFWKDVVIEPH